MVIVFAGTPAFAVPSLRALAASPHDLAAVYTQPDRPAGRGRRVAPSPVKEAAMELGLALEQPASLRAPDVQARIKALHPDLMVVAAYGLILPAEVLSIPLLGCINVHASLLPRWRGAAPVQHALLTGDEKTGVTIMQMDEGVDTGGLLLKRCCPIRLDDTGGSLTMRLAKLGAAALHEALEQFARGELGPAKPQDDALATLAPRIHTRDARLDWSRDARELERRVRAFHPSPMAFTWLNGERIRILRAEVTMGVHPGGTNRADTEPPGTVLTAGADGIEVRAGRDRLRVLELQRPGKRVMNAREFLQGRPVSPGQRFDDPEAI